MATYTDKYAAGEQGLGYVYQIRFALSHLMKVGLEHQDAPVLVLQAIPGGEGVWLARHMGYVIRHRATPFPNRWRRS
mgnify:CR=1 FL=1